MKTSEGSRREAVPGCPASAAGLCKKNRPGSRVPRAAGQPCPRQSPATPQKPTSREAQNPKSTAKPGPTEKAHLLRSSKPKIHYKTPQCRKAHISRSLVLKFCKQSYNAPKSSLLQSYINQVRRTSCFRLSDRCRRSSLVATPKIIHRMIFVCDIANC